MEGLINFPAVHQGLSLLFTSFDPWMVVIPGLLIGLVFGAIPGLQISMAMAIFLPITLKMDFTMSMLFLTAIFTGGGFGGGVTAILMNIPGTSSAMATAFDGYPMSRAGKHNEALGYALGASTFGCGLGYIILFVLIQPISVMVLKLGPTEMFSITLWGLTLIASLKGDYIGKGLASGLIGLLIGTIGFNEMGTERGTMGLELLLDGVPAVPAMMGMFAASELFNLLNAKFIVEKEEHRKVHIPRVVNAFFDSFRHMFINTRGGLIGVLIGAIPGVGSSVANLLSYMETKRRDKDPDTFGKGNFRGVLASESANSSSEAGSLATLLALGIPGGGATAVMLAVFAMNNITGGPTFIRMQTDVVYAIIFANFGQVILLAVIGLLMIPLLGSLVKVPVRVLIPVVLTLSVFGAYGLTGNMAGPYTLLFFAVLGFLMKKYNYSVPGIVIGILLGGMAESELLHSYQISGASVLFIFQRPLTLIILLLLIFSATYQPVLKFIKKKFNGRRNLTEA